MTIATFNVENLGGNASDAAFTARANLIVNHLAGPDILVLEEIQDNNGAADDGTTAADVTYSRLISAVQAAGGPLYAFQQIDPQDKQDGGAPGGNIRSAFCTTHPGSHQQPPVQAMQRHPTAWPVRPVWPL